MRKLVCLIGVNFMSIFGSCSPMVTPPQSEYILRDTFDLAKDEQRHSILFECPSHEVMHFLFRVNTMKADVDVEHIRNTWESNYSATVCVNDVGGSLVYSNRFDSSKGNISTGGNWFEPDVAIILGDGNEWTFLAEEHKYNIEIILTGKGLEEHDLDFFVRRIFY